MREKELSKLGKVSYLLCIGYRLREVAVDDIEVSESVSELAKSRTLRYKSTSMVVLHKKENGKYEVLMGCTEYAIAVRAGEKNITALVGDLEREDFFKEYHKGRKQLPALIREIEDKIKSPKMKISDIAVPEKYSWVRTSKMQREMIYLFEHKEFSKPVKISEADNSLAGGYSRYIAAKYMGLKNVSVEFVNDGKRKKRIGVKATGRKREKTTLEELLKSRKAYINARQAADVMNMDYKNFRKMLGEGKFSFPHFKMKRYWIILREPFIEYVTGRKKESE